ncbi:MAG TPA: acyl-ACP--UDP-N-acetylglucosamine O-acyltransferase [Candidatus Brocadiia bacterium]|nr:acyl-ACP--UDP-N-acetylglucosamine O-acyltransferase [Candidatus Brocadiia bacterium]
MSVEIHPTAVVDPKARIGDGCRIGPYAVIGPDVVLGERNELRAHSMISGWTTIGNDNVFFPFSHIGGEPQDLKFHGEETYIVIGDGNVFRESSTVNRGTVTGGGTTKLGNRNMLMSCSHVAHDCELEDDIIIANMAGLGGHCKVEKGAKIMGLTGINTFTTVGRYAFVCGMTRIAWDVPPFMFVEGHPSRVRKLNRIGIERSGFSPERVNALQEAFNLLWRSKQYSKPEAMKILEERADITEDVKYLLEFLRKMDMGMHGRFRESLRM